MKYEANDLNDGRTKLREKFVSFIKKKKKKKKKLYKTNVSLLYILSDKINRLLLA